MRPYIIINYAQSVNGIMAGPHGEQVRLSNEEDMARVHRLRHEADAVLVGIGTVINDDPKLTVKEKYVPNPKQPLRVVVDSKGRVPPNSLVLNDTAKTLIFVSGLWNGKEIPGAEVIVCGSEKVDLEKMLSMLHEKGVKKALVEGGGTLIWSLVEQGLFHELQVFISPQLLPNGPNVRDEMSTDRKNLLLRQESCKTIGNGVLLTYIPIKGNP